MLRRVDVDAGWREIYDGPVPEVGYEPGEPGPRCLVFAARKGDGWIALTFQRQAHESWTTLLSTEL